MATVLLWTNAAGRADSLALDVVDQEGHEAMVDITEFPVEEGVEITDHARPQTPRIQIQGYVSMKPMLGNPGVDKLASMQRVDFLGVLQGTRTGTRQVPLTYPDDAPLIASLSFNGLTKAINRAIRPLPRSYTATAEVRFDEKAMSAQLLAFNDFTNRCRVVGEKLEECRQRGYRISVHSAFRDYENMLIEREAEPRTAADGNGIVFQIDLRQIRTVNSEKVDAPKPAEGRGAASVSVGSKAAEKDKNAAAKKKSFAARGFDSFTGLGMGD